MDPESVRERYTKLAPDYDRMMSFWAPADRWRRRAVAETNIGEGDTVLDPFSGRGTTPTQACVDGRIGLASELNPLAYMLSRAKVDPCQGR